MPRRRKAALIGVLILLGVASSLFLRREAQMPDIRSPKAPGLPIFAGNLTTSARRLLLSVRPEYPPALRHLGYQVVRLRCSVLEDGSVTDIWQEGGPAELFPYAKAAVEQWRYEPVHLYDAYTGKSRAVGFVVVVEVPFGQTRQ